MDQPECLHSAFETSAFRERFALPFIVKPLGGYGCVFFSARLSVEWVFLEMELTDVRAGGLSLTEQV